MCGIADSSGGGGQVRIHLKSLMALKTTLYSHGVDQQTLCFEDTPFFSIYKKKIALPHVTLATAWESSEQHCRQLVSENTSESNFKIVLSKKVTASTYKA